MPPSLSTRIGMWIFSFAAVAFGTLEVYGVNHHAHDPAWPAHAKFHAITGLFDELALCILALLFTWRFLRRGEPWSWWALALVGFALFGGLVLSNPLSHGGMSGSGESLGNPRLFTALAWISVVLWAAGLALTRAHVRAKA